MADTAKSINGLMRHLRDDCNINIQGSKHKKQLTHYGYYHGYKGYRFFKTRNNILPYTQFDQLVAVIEYDNILKSIFYPELMYLEMALKNIVLNQVVCDMRDVSFDNIYKTKMADENNNRKLKLRRLQLKDKIHSSLSKSYKDENSMVSHFYNRGEEVPLWVIFEIIVLGDFASFTACLDKPNRIKLANEINLCSASDTNYQLLSNSLYTLKSLRNAVAHNNIIFDTRFQDRGVNRNVVSWLKQKTSIANIDFKYITDYLILICCLLDSIDADKTRIKKLVNKFEEAVNDIYTKLPTNIYTKIVSTDVLVKIQALREYIQNH